ncbi:MAG: TolC family protein [Ferruginibacter sp.]
MKKYFFLVLFCTVEIASAQTVAKMPDSIRQIVDKYNGTGSNALNSSNPGYVIVNDNDEAIKDRLIKLALKSDAVVAANANTEIAEIARKKANSSLLNSLSLGGNANEFVINSSPQASFYPKYNFGVTVPLDVFARNKAEKHTADQNIIFNNAQMELLKKNLKSRVLILYANYKEKVQQLELEKIAIEEDVSAYENAQKDFKDETITLEQLNRIYRNTIVQKSLLAEKERDLDIATIQLEELIGVPIKTVLQK